MWEKRPTGNEEIIKRIVATKIAPKLQSELSMPVKDIVEDMVGEIEQYHDGYENARRLDGEWDINMGIVEWLDALPWSEVIDEETKKWVEQNNIKLEKDIGNIVKFKTSMKTMEGEITKLYPDQARYLVCCESEGHVKEGLGTHGFYVEAENLLNAVTEIDNSADVTPRTTTTAGHECDGIGHA